MAYEAWAQDWRHAVENGKGMLCLNRHHTLPYA